MTHHLKRLATILVTLASAACATPGPVLTESVGAMRTGLVSTKAQTSEAFEAINAGAREDTITRLLAREEGPAEAAFNPIIPDRTAQQWATAYSAIDAYLAGLQELVAPERAAAVTADLTALANTLASPSFGVQLPDGAAGLFGGLGGAILQAASERKAQDVMRRTDAAFEQLTRGMADLVLFDDPARLGTLRNFVEDHWNTVLSGIENDYRRIATGPADARRSNLERYGEAFDRRAAQRLKLVRLRDSLLAMGQAHANAARGAPGATLYWIGRINDLLKEAREAS